MPSKYSIKVYILRRKQSLNNFTAKEFKMCNEPEGREVLSAYGTFGQLLRENDQHQSYVG